MAIPIIGVSILLIQNYLMPNGLTQTPEQKELAKTEYIFEKYPAPHYLIEGLNNGTVSCDDLSNETKRLVNIFQDGICK